MLDYGYPQFTNIETLKSCIYNEAVPVETPPVVTSLKFSTGFPQIAPKTVPSNAAHRPIDTVAKQRNPGTRRKNEIFVDILERLTLALSSNGCILNSSIEGSIQMKSFLSGHPELRLALNENLALKSEERRGGNAVLLDDYNFHECVDLKEFDEMKIMSLVPPDGEFTVMNYRITGEFAIPFRIVPTIEQISQHKLELVIKIRAEIPEQNYGGNVSVTCPLPKHTASVSTELFPSSAIQGAEYVASEGRIVWNIKKFTGGSEHALKCRLALSQPSTSPIKKETGPISMTFEIPMYNVSNMQVRYLRISETHPNYNPFRWVRYVTQTASYVCRMT
eukprot:Selendium_serpulae@DN5724_c1_g1_i1.p1